MEEYIGIIKPFIGNSFVPEGWLLCDGRKLPIGQYEVLYTIIGTTYGGDGMQDFALPDLRSRVPIGFGQAPGGTSRPIGSKGGSETSVIDLNTLASHSHNSFALGAAANSDTPKDNFLTLTGNDRYCRKDSTDTEIPMNTEVISVAAGGGQTHENLPPYMVINYIICNIGIYPSKA